MLLFVVLKIESMKIRIYTKFFLIALSFLCVSASKLLAQTTNVPQNRYSLHVKQNYSHWGDCNSDPDYEYAAIELIYKTNVGLSKITFGFGGLGLPYEFDHNFTNEDPNKSLETLFGKYGSTIEEIKVDTKVSDITNDTKLSYTFTKDELHMGVNVESHSASDPCNNWVSNNREGYTMTTMVYIDDPVYFRFTNPDTDFQLEYEKLSLTIGDFYQNGLGSPKLQVKRTSEGDNMWRTLPVTVSPNSTLNLSYKNIAGEQDGQNTHFYEWMGKSLEFRIVKKLLNNSYTSGNIISTVRFYPSAPEYNVLYTDRNYCDSVITFIEFVDNIDAGYTNDNHFFWRAKIGVNLYDCYMVPTTLNDFHHGTNIFRISLKNSGMDVDPYTNSVVPVNGTLQLEDANLESGSNGFACDRDFVIPPRPLPITAEKAPSRFLIGTQYYDLPSKSNPYAILKITDDEEIYNRKPYTITDGTKTLAIIDEFPTTYENMSVHEKDSIDDLFNEHFEKLTNLDSTPNNAYLSYFRYKYKEWFDNQNATSPSYRITHPNGASQFFVSKYHSHSHSHSCTHSHTHIHYCNCIPSKKMSDTLKINNTQKLPNCPSGYTMECHEDDHSLANPDPHNLCSHTSHAVESGADWSQTHDDTHTHIEYHSHIHTNTGIHAHGENSNYDYTLIKKVNLSNDEVSNFSTTYNDIDNINLTTTGLNAQYIFRKDGVDISVVIWTEQNIMNTLYPANLMAEEWYNDYKAQYKEKWLDDQLGVKVPGVKVNDDQTLMIIDKDGCIYDPFTIHVTAPNFILLDVSNEQPPVSACSNNGSAKITYKGGGNLPYTCKYGTLGNLNEFIIANDLTYGTQDVIFTDGNGNTINIPVNIPGSLALTITPKSQTSTVINGEIKVDVGNGFNLPIKYTLTYVPTNKSVETTLNSRTHTFNQLISGSYKIKVESGTCTPIITEAKVEDEIFNIRINLNHASIIGGKGKIDFAFDDDRQVTWSNAPTGFSISNSNTASYNVEPGTYNFSAIYSDSYNRQCTVPFNNIIINEPQFNAVINIHENEDSAIITPQLISSNALITAYEFRILNSSRVEINPAVIKTTGNYIVNFVYGSNNIDIYSFTYPSNSITNGQNVNNPICPGGIGKITFNPKDGIDGLNILISENGFDYTTTQEYNKEEGIYEFKLKDIYTTNVSNQNIYGNSLTVNHELVNSFTIPVIDPNPVTAIIIPIDITCAGKNDGRVSITEMSEGSGTYQYRVDNTSWKSPQTETTGLTPGNHVVYLRDSYNNCPAVNLTNFTISQPDSLKIDSVRIVQPTCELENGEIFVEARGGNGLFQFDWTKNGSSFYSNNTLEEDSITHLGDSLQYGFYRLNIKDDNNCLLTYNVELNEYFNPQITNTDITEVRCYGETNGEIKITEVTGTNPFNKIILRGLDFVHKDTINSIANSFNSLPKGRYELQTIDDSACVSTTPYLFTINQPDTILYAIVDTVVPAIYKGTNTGRIFSTVYGGNAGLKTFSLLDLNNVTVDQQFERNQFLVYFDSLYAGNYSLLISDEKGCTFNSSELLVTEPQTALGFNVIQKKDAMCKAQTGSFTIEGYGGWGNYSYKRASDNGYYNFNSFNNLYAGNYIVSVQDKLGAVFTDTIVIYEPKDSLQATLIESLDPTCGNNGSLSLNLKGGIAPYKLFFENSSDTTTIPATQDYTFVNRPAGGYLLHLTDNNGCKFELETELSDSKLIDIADFELTYPSANGANDGVIKAIVNGGKAPLSFAWKELFGNALAETSSMLTNVSSGHYELTVSEQGGCSQAGTVYLPNISDMALEIVELQHETSYLAQNGYSKLFSNLELLVNVEVIYPQGTRTFYTVSDSTANFYEKNNNLYLRNLTGGSYFVMVTNNVGEKAYAEFEIEPYHQFYFDAIQISPVKEINDSSGIVSVVVAGGAGDNRFAWEYLDGVVNHLDSVNYEFTSILNNAIAGNYRITATDKYNNSITQTLVIEQPAAPLEIAISEYRNESCKDYEDAYVIIQASGGWGDYQFKPDVEGYYSNNNTWLNLDVREHYFYLSDKMGTIDSIAITITEPEYLKSNVSFIDSVNCKNANDGNIFFNITGGSAPYRFLLQEPSTLWKQDTVARNLTEGIYSFIFTDKNNCVGQDTVITYMPEPDSLLFDYIDVTHTTCNTNNGAIKVDMQGGTYPYRYEWADFGGNIIGNESSVFGLKQNTRYFLNVFDVHNCMQEHDQFIKPSTNPIIIDIDTTPVLCYSGSNGTAHIVEVTPAEPFAPYSFTWSNSDSGEYSEGYQAGIHSVTISDTNNCSTVKFFEITQPDTMLLTVTDFKDAHCFGYNDGFIEIQASGGVGSYQFIWSNGEITERIGSLYKGIYSVTIIDANLCAIQDTFEIIEPDQLIVDLGDDIRICPGNALTIDGQDFTTHQWSNSTGVFSNGQFISVDTEDTYYLEVTNSIGCFAHDEISITIGNDALQADFLMTSIANLGDTLFIYEISNIELDSLYWDYNPEAFNNIPDYSLPNYMLQLKSNELGIYNVGLWAYSGGCISMVTKQVEIIQSNDSIDDDDFMGYNDPLITEISIYPNPTDGNFTVKVVLREIADIQLNIFSVNQGVIIDKRNDFGMDYYEIDYRLNDLNTGVYVILVTAKNEKKQIKIIVQ